MKGQSIRFEYDGQAIEITINSSRKENQSGRKIMFFNLKVTRDGENINDLDIIQENMDATGKTDSEILNQLKTITILKLKTK